MISMNWSKKFFVGAALSFCCHANANGVGLVQLFNAPEDVKFELVTVKGQPPTESEKLRYAAMIIQVVVADWLTAGTTEQDLGSYRTAIDSGCYSHAPDAVRECFVYISQETVDIEAPRSYKVLSERTYRLNFKRIRAKKSDPFLIENKKIFLTIE